MQEQQVVRAIENMEEPKPDEARRRLVPSRVEPHQPGIADEFERTDGPARRDEPNDCDHPYAEPRQRGVNGEPGLFAVDGVLEPHVQQRLVPRHVDFTRKGRRGEVRNGVLIGDEGPVRFERHASRHHTRSFRQPRGILVEFDEVRDPQRCHLGKQRCGEVRIQVAVPSLRENDVADRFQRHPNQHIQVLAFWLDEQLSGDVVRDIVSRGYEGQRK
jgi:hypothetical protein